MKKYATLIALVITSVVAGQQLETDNSSNSFAGGISSIWQFHTFNAGGEEVKGDPFLFADWNKGGKGYSGDRVVDLGRVNYNIYTDEFGSMKSQDSVFFYNKRLVDSITVRGRSFHNYHNKYYEVMFNGGKASLLKRYEIEIIEGMFNPTDGTTQKSRIKKTDDYFLKKNGQITLFKPSKSAFQALFGSDESAMKKQMKKEKLSTKKEKDLIRIFELYNQI